MCVGLWSAFLNKYQCFDIQWSVNGLNCGRDKECNGANIGLTTTSIFRTAVNETHMNLFIVLSSNMDEIMNSFFIKYLTLKQNETFSCLTQISFDNAVF